MPNEPGSSGHAVQDSPCPLNAASYHPTAASVLQFLENHALARQFPGGNVHRAVTGWVRLCVRGGAELVSKRCAIAGRPTGRRCAVDTTCGLSLLTQLAVALRRIANRGAPHSGQ